MAGRATADPGHRARRVIARRVDDQHVHAVGAELLRDSLCLDKRLLAEQRDVAATVTDEHEQRIHRRVTQPFGADDAEPGDEPVRQRRRPPDREALEALLGEVDG